MLRVLLSLCVLLPLSEALFGSPCGCGGYAAPPPLLPPPCPPKISFPPLCPPMPPPCPLPLPCPPQTCPAPLPCPPPPPPPMCPPPLPPLPSPCTNYVQAPLPLPQLSLPPLPSVSYNMGPPSFPPMFPPPLPPMYVAPPTNDCCCGCGSPCQFRSLARMHGSKTLRTDEMEEEDPTCNNKRLRAVMVDNLTSDPSQSKRAIQRAAEDKLEGRFNVICAKGDFTYVAYTDQYCQASNDDVTCYAFQPM